MLVVLLPRRKRPAQAVRARGVAHHPGDLDRHGARSSTAGGGYQFVEIHDWIPAFGAHYAVGLDGLGLVLVLLTTILTPVVILASWHDADDGRWSVNSFFAWMLALEGLAIGVFAATDVFLFYVLFEATLIPIYFLIGGFGGARRVVRGGQVPALQPVRRAADAGVGRRAVRRLVGLGKAVRRTCSKT